MDTLKQQILDKTEKKPLDSKKMLIGLYGTGAVLIVWFGTLVCMFIKATDAAQFVSLATIVVSFIGAIATALITGQSAMEWKSMATVATVDTNDKEEKKVESVKTENQNINIHEDIEQHIKEEGVNAPEFKPFGAHALGDEEHGEYHDFER